MQIEVKKCVFCHFSDISLLDKWIVAFLWSHMTELPQTVFVPVRIGPQCLVLASPRF